MPDHPTSNWLACAACAAAVVAHLIVLYAPAPPGGTASVPGTDKAIHVLIFGVVMLTGRLAGLPAVPLASGLAVHAVISELVQHYALANRTGDGWDVVADLTGIALGWYVTTMITRHWLQR